ncbi:MAG: hypothetical protein HWE10_13510 [Gammaproteobacteria bacterium]|nr:hypothetical protein [Gammaproteobacteria bacterium]
MSKLALIFVSIFLVFGCSTTQKLHINKNHFDSNNFKTKEYYTNNCDFTGNVIEAESGNQVYELSCSQSNYNRLITEYGQFLHELAATDPVDAGYVKIKSKNNSGNLESFKFFDVYSERSPLGSPAFSELLIFVHYENYFDQKGSISHISINPIKLKYHGKRKPNLNLVDRFQLIYSCKGGQVMMEAKDRTEIYIPDTIEATSNLEFEVNGTSTSANLTSDYSVGRLSKFDNDIEVKIVSASNNEIHLDSFNMVIEKGTDLYKFIRNPANNGHARVFTKTGEKIDISIFPYINIALEKKLEQLCSVNHK